VWSPLEIDRNWWISSSRSHDYRCVKCCSARNRDYNLQHTTEKKAYAVAYYRLHRADIRARSKSYYIKNHKTILEGQRKRRRELKEACIKKFGGKCVYCGEREHSFLTFGHMNEGDGARHRFALTGHSQRGGGISFYLQLLRDGTEDRYPAQLNASTATTRREASGYCVKK
jgi:hypothetical protein